MVPETRQIFSRMLVMTNILKSCLLLFKMESLLIVVSMCLLRRSLASWAATSVKK